ncbi:alpha-1,3-mannosyl-glycoprotein 4-beta-N-acetylglucosaminyltransferase C-like isoform X2 [Palaemon carinicauda]|uniref:alpha-1,3-mannosyl-glycoprotein 4-beta-N-acetylglucosaminyltransferase C-like isoform X2 n=1 Tax=Palaemon carinicauda TaxID=392227 RepID=UPI0035B58E4B
MLEMKSRTIRVSFGLILGFPTLVIFCYVTWFVKNSSRNSIGYAQLSKRAQVSDNNDIDTLSHSFQGKLTYDLAGIRYPLSIPDDTVLFGKDVAVDERKRFLTIGISSVWRKDNYLSGTIDSILQETSSEEQRDIFIFILLADPDPKVRLQRARDLNQRYEREIEAGLLRVLQPAPDLYLSLNSTTRRTYNDSVDRVKWRVKQVLDFAFLFWYTWTVQPSTYYLVLEDDVLSAPNFFSGFIIIGQLLRCQDLNLLVTFFLLFHREHPVDFLFQYWITLMAPESSPDGLPTRRIPGLFQHVGIHSTLANKTQPIKDRTFGGKRLQHNNPEARVVTTMKPYQNYGPEQPYSSLPGMFWGIAKPGDTFDVIFTKPLNVSRVVVRTGAILNNRIRDRLEYGILEVSSRFLRMLNPTKASCEGFTTIQRFKKGMIDVKHLLHFFPGGIQCVRINVGTKQKSWIIITEISVVTDSNN